MIVYMFHHIHWKKIIFSRFPKDTCKESHGTDLNVNFSKTKFY